MVSLSDGMCAFRMVCVLLWNGLRVPLGASEMGGGSSGGEGWDGVA